MSLFVRLCLLASIMLCILSSAFSQSGNLDFFELSIEPSQDSATNRILYLLAVSSPDDVSAIDFSVKNEQGMILSHINSSIANLIATYPYRMENGILYLTIETGAYAPSLYYEATATLTPLSGEAIEYTRMKQM